MFSLVNGFGAFMDVLAFHMTNIPLIWPTHLYILYSLFLVLFCLFCVWLALFYVNMVSFCLLFYIYVLSLSRLNLLLTHDA